MKNSSYQTIARSLTRMGAVALLCATSFTASAVHYEGILSEANEEFPTGSPGSGFVSIDYDPIGHLLTFDITFQGLIGLTTGAHIHIARPGASGPFAFGVPHIEGFPDGVTTGTYMRTFDLTLDDQYAAGFFADSGGTAAGAEAALADVLASGRGYLNIHTTEWPGGEIRANLPGVPDGGTTAAFLLLGLAGIAGVARRRRKDAGGAGDSSRTA